MTDPLDAHTNADETNARLYLIVMCVAIFLVFAAIGFLCSMTIFTAQAAAPADDYPTIALEGCHLAVFNWTQPPIVVDPLDPPAGFMWLERPGASSLAFPLEFASCIHGYCTWYAVYQIPYPAKDWMVQGYIVGNHEPIFAAKRERVPCSVWLPVVLP